MKEQHLPYDRFLILLGTISIFACLIKAFPSALSIPVFLLFALPLFFLIQWIVLKKSGRLLLGFFLLFFVIMFLFRFQLIEGFQYLYNQMVEVYASSDHYVFNTYELNEGSYHILYSTFCLIILFVCYVLVITVTVSNHSWYFLDFTLSLSLFVPTIMYRVPQSFLLDALLFSFWILLFLSGILAKNGALDSMERRAFRRVIAIVFAITFGLLCIFPQFAFQKSQWIEDRRLQIQMLYRNIIQQAVPETEGEIDLRNAQDRHYLNVEQMSVSASQIKDYYIKTFSGSTYEDQKWVMLKDNIYTSKNIPWKTVYLWYDETHTKEAAASTPIQTLQIEDKRALRRYALVPYDVAEMPDTMQIQYDAFATSDEDTYEYRLWDIEEHGEQEYQNGQQRYRQFVENQYLKLPADVSSLFDELEFSNPNVPYSFEDAATLIKDYLSSETSYTLKPGATPQGKDFVSYFLTENKKGYCVHYASSATLMFRYLGIPARYVEGYHISQNSFNSQGIADVLDSQAHAWVEVLDEERGWVPVEVTPPAQSSTSTTQQQTLGGNEPEQNGNNTKPQTNEGNENNENGNQNTKPVKDTTADIDFHLEILIPVAVVLLLVITILWIHHRRRYTWIKRMIQKNRKQALVQCDAYLQQWSSYGIELSQDDHQLLEKAMYSHHMISEVEYQKVYQHLMQKVQACYQKLSIKDKLYVIFWKALK